MPRYCFIQGFGFRQIWIQPVGKIAYRLRAAPALVLIFDLAKSCLLPFFEFVDNVCPSEFLIFSRIVGRIRGLPVIPHEGHTCT